MSSSKAAPKHKDLHKETSSRLHWKTGVSFAFAGQGRIIMELGLSSLEEDTQNKKKVEKKYPSKYSIIMVTIIISLWRVFYPADPLSLS